MVAAKTGGIDMSSTLNEITYQRLQEFRRRRTALAASRGWSAVITVFVLAVFLAVIIDAISTNDFMRWTASGLVYSLTLATWFWSCWRPLHAREPLQSEAQRFEAADPRLREHLLTAVELADTGRETLHDSRAFKELLQWRVSQLIAPVDVRRLLPWYLVRKWLLAAIAALMVFLLLGFVPQLHWMNRVARALMPAANLDRVARVAITIEEPQPNSKIIAAGDILAIVARVEGPAPSLVLIESRSIDGDAANIPMQDHPRIDPLERDRGQTAMRYHATLSTDQPWIEYRVTADRSSTAWHRLTTQPRPSVLQFTKTLTPPAYSKLAQVVQDNSDGNIRAIVGTHVKLAVELSQPVSVAELHWQSTSGTEGVERYETSHKLERDVASGLYITEFTLEQSGTYRVHLKSAVTGFVNEFSPSYSVDAIMDLKPDVAWTQPVLPRQTVAPDQILGLAAQIQDEMPVESLKQLTRINRDGPWRESVVAGESLKPAASDVQQSLTGIRSSTQATWQVDLLKLSVLVGDVVEMKLVAEDRLSQTVESSIIELLVSESTITVFPTPAERLRQTVATELESFAQRIGQQEQAVQELAKPKSLPQSDDQITDQSAKLVDAADALAALTRVEIPKLLKLIEQAASQTEDSASLLELEQAGQTLSMLKLRNTSELAAIAKELAKPADQLPATRRVDREKELAQHSNRLEQTSQTTATLFRSMVSQDVGRRLSEQVAKLEQLFANFGESNSNPEASSNLEQNHRAAMVLSRQLMELQQSMLDALPSVRQDTKQRLRQSADAISNLVNQLDALNPKADLAEMKKLAEQIEKSLSQMKNAAWFDGGLHDAIINGHRRFSEFAGQPVDQLHRAIANLLPRANIGVDISAATTDAVLENLSDRRALMRTRKEGDREFASDLGNAARAIREITLNDSLTKSDQQRALTETASALETLQAAHGVKESMALLEDLLRGERWALSTTDAMVNHPILYDSFAERLENAVKLLRQAKVSNELVDSIERLRWHDANAKAGQKINSRRWENRPPVSAAAELNQLSEQLALANSQLDPVIQLARAKLAEQAPSLSELAQKAASATRELQQQTESLAKAVERKEIADESTQLAQLHSEQQQTELPIAELRDALVDHADAQNLLQQQQLLNAREADAALAVVDSAKEQIDASVQSVTGPVEPSERAKLLDSAADQQAGAADKLDQLAQHFDARSQLNSEEHNEQSVSQSLMQLAEELGGSAEAQQRYNEAARLAELAAAKPDEVLRQLEQKLTKSPPMQQEMSRISQELAEQALNRLDRAANQQQKIPPALESSDPRLQAQKKILLQDLQSARENINQVLGLLVSEAKWTSGAGKEEASQKQIESVENQLRSSLAAAEKANSDRTFTEIRATAAAFAESLKTASDSLNSTSQLLQDASGRKIHQNDADLANRRREMQDRQRRISQHDVLNLQQAERQQQQLLRQAENELKQVEQREKSLQQHRTNLQKEVDKHPDNPSLKQQLNDAQRNLGYGQAQMHAATQAKQQMMQRVDAAIQSRDTVSNKKQAELDSINPSAQLASALSRTAAERSDQLAKQLGAWQEASLSALKPEANVAQLQNSSQEERAVHLSVQDSAEDLSRASRHEQRLKSQPASQQLASQSAAIAELNTHEIRSAEQALTGAIENSKRPDATTGQASGDITQDALSNLQAADTAIRSRAEQLRAMLATSKNPASKSGKSQTAAESESESDLLNSKQLAQLLDELDRQMNLGQKDNDAASQTASTSPNKQTPSTLAAAAQQISSQLSRNRQPAPQPNADRAMATESTSANVDPQGPVAVKVLDVNRVGADWGKLREQASENMLESQRETVSPAYRLQIEAYFRSLAELGQAIKRK